MFTPVTGVRGMPQKKLASGNGSNGNNAQNPQPSTPSVDLSATALMARFRALPENTQDRYSSWFLGKRNALARFGRNTPEAVELATEIHEWLEPQEARANGTYSQYRKLKKTKAEGKKLAEVEAGAI